MSTKLEVDRPTIVRACRYVRTKFNIPEGDCTTEFNREYNCKYLPKLSSFSKHYIEFESSDDALLWQLKWG